MFVTVSLLLAAVCLLPAASKILGHRYPAPPGGTGWDWPS
jgi:hypothetical protein